MNKEHGCSSSLAKMILKILFLISALSFLSACHSSASKNEGLSATPSPTAANYNASNSPSNPPETSKAEQTKQSEMEARNEKFRVIPEAFKQINFENFSYPYKFSYGRKKKFNIALEAGKQTYEVTDDRGWFSLSDVYYVDLTNDGKPEAIVILWHVTCGTSCDGGAGLFYIYTLRQTNLKLLWRYETGSLAYGCGLKSFTVKNRKMTMELFGRCFDEIKESLGLGKFLVKDTTRLTFGFNGRKFVEEKKEFISVPERSVMNYDAEISINE